MAKFNPLAAAVAAGSAQVTGIGALIETFAAEFGEFANAAKVADTKSDSAKLAGKAGAVWPHARTLMTMVAEHKLTQPDWKTVVTHFMLALELEESSTAKSYKSTLLNAPYALASPAAIKVNGNKPVDLANASYADVRNTMKAVKDEMFAAHDPVAVRFAKRLAEVKELLSNVTKDTKELKGISFESGIELLDSIAGLVPEREAKATSDTPITDAANEGTDVSEITKAA